MTARRRVLLTGGAGSIATGFARAAADEYDFTLLDLPGRFDDRHAALGSLVETDVADIAALRDAMRGVDTVVHLAGERRPGAAWSTLLPANIVGTYNTVTAALAAGCRRFVYASSVHAVSGYPAGEQIRESDPVLPADLYGVTKCFGEALGAYVAAREGLSFAALRIGAFQPTERLSEPESGWILRDFCAPDDLYELLRRVIEKEDLDFAVYNAISGNRFGRLSMAKAREELGFVPEYDSFHLVDPFRAALGASDELRDKVFPSGMREELVLLSDERGE